MPVQPTRRATMKTAAVERNDESVSGGDFRLEPVTNSLGERAYVPTRRLQERTPRPRFQHEIGARPERDAPREAHAIQTRSTPLPANRSQSTRNTLKRATQARTYAPTSPASQPPPHPGTVSGATTTYSTQGAGPVDVTTEHIARLELRIDQIDDKLDDALTKLQALTD